MNLVPQQHSGYSDSSNSCKSKSEDSSSDPRSQRLPADVTAYPPNQLGLSLHDLPCVADYGSGSRGEIEFVCSKHGHAGVMAYGTPLRFSGQARNGRAQQSRETCCVCDNSCAWSGWWRSTVCEFKPNAFVSLSIFVSVSVSSPLPSLFLPSLSHAISPSACYAHWSSKACTAVLRYLDAIWYSNTVPLQRSAHFLCCVSFFLCHL